MSLLERKESVKRTIVSFKTEVDRKLVEEEARKNLLEGEKLKKERIEIKEQQLADKNWNEIKPLLLNSLRNINKEIFDNQGKISDWKEIKTERHAHISETHIDGEDQTWAYPHSYLVEASSINIKDIGDISLFRVFTEYVYAHTPMSGWYTKGKTINIPSKSFCITISKDLCPEKSKNLSLLFSNHALNEYSHKAEDIILDKIEKLHKY
jgi:hypothetical protein